MNRLPSSISVYAKLFCRTALGVVWLAGVALTARGAAGDTTAAPPAGEEGLRETNPKIQELLAEGRAKINAGAYQDAAKIYDAVLALNPNVAEAKNNLSQINTKILPLIDRLKGYVIPQLELADVPLPEVLTKLTELSKDYTKAGQEISFVLVKPASGAAAAIPQITLSMRSVSILSVINTLCALTHYTMQLPMDPLAGKPLSLAGAGPLKAPTVLFYAPGETPAPSDILFISKPTTAVPSTPATPTTEPSTPASIQAKIEALVAKGPGATSVVRLEIFELDAGTTASYRIRKDVVSIPLPSAMPMRGRAYYLPTEKRFYFQWDDGFSSTLHYYGPFEGDPVKVLGLPEPAKPTSSPGTP